MRPLMRRLLPETVAVGEVRGDLTEPPLFPEEEAVVEKAVDKRRREFATGRRCARRALAELGHPPVPLLPADRGAPGWPAGVVGAISHCPGYRVAAVARATDLAALGIDAEPAEPPPDGVLEAVSLPAERADLARLAREHPAVPWGRLLFSAKESVYKAWSPHAGRMLGFEEARLRLAVEPDAAGPGIRGTFTARLLVPLPPAVAAVTGPAGEFAGRWLVDDGLVLTAVLAPARSAGTAPASSTAFGRARR
ncbi:4'-phosphopantetheinyl transferase [Streptomyces sp. NPDC051041]|uniref:4'-phosphopantetheinyl transferase n=1 Tax=Streptomyces sp. NPDC051041 TaxID=3365640 RepID=UPI00379C224E